MYLEGTLYLLNSPDVTNSLVLKMYSFYAQVYPSIEDFPVFRHYKIPGKGSNCLFYSLLFLRLDLIALF
jgi:hypothetical protein